MPLNKKIQDLDDGETCLVEKTIELVRPPAEGKKAMRVKFVDDGRTYYTNRAVNLLKPGDKVSVTIRASGYNDQIYLWLDDWQRIQKEKLPL